MCWAFEHVQNVQIQIIMHVSKVSSGPFSPFIHSVVSNYSVSGQWRPWSDCPPTQSDLGPQNLHMLGWAHVMTVKQPARIGYSRLQYWPYCPIDITQKESFCLAFWLTTSYQKPFVFSVSLCSFSNIYPKIKFTPNNWSDLRNFYSKALFGNFCLKYYYFFFFFCWIWITDVSQQYCENVRKKLNMRNLIKIQVTYPTDFCIICVNFYYGEKVKCNWFFIKKTND